MEDCRPSLHVVKKKSLRKSIGVEVILRNGTRRYYRPRSTSKKDIQVEVFTFIKSLEKATNQNVMWRFRGDELFHMGTETFAAAVEKSSLKEKGKKILDYFFDLED